METKNLKLECDKIWDNLPNLDKSMPNQDFFDQGGTSLTLIKLLEETKNKFNIDLDINKLAQGLTLNIFHELVEQKLKN